MQSLVSIQCFVLKIKHFEICDVPDERVSEMPQKRILNVQSSEVKADELLVESTLILVQFYGRHFCVPLMDTNMATAY